MQLGLESRYCLFAICRVRLRPRGVAEVLAVSGSSSTTRSGYHQDNITAFSTLEQYNICRCQCWVTFRTTCPAGLLVWANKPPPTLRFEITAGSLSNSTERQFLTIFSYLCMIGLQMCCPIIQLWCWERNVEWLELSRSGLSPIPCCLEVASMRNVQQRPLYACTHV